MLSWRFGVWLIHLSSDEDETNCIYLHIIDGRNTKPPTVSEKLSDTVNFCEDLNKKCDFLFGMI